MENALELCITVNQPWKAASLRGGCLFVDPHLGKLISQKKILVIRKMQISKETKTILYGKRLALLWLQIILLTCTKEQFTPHWQGML
jgi:hypothetical protein